MRLAGAVVGHRDTPRLAAHFAVLDVFLVVPAAGVEGDLHGLAAVRAGDDRSGLGGSITEREFFVEVSLLILGMKINHRNLCAALALAVACGDGASEPHFSGGGPTTFKLTDAPFPYDKVSRVDIYVVKVQASWAGDTTAGATNDFVTVADVNRKINVLALEGGLTDVLGTANVPEGAIKAVRMIIDTDQSSITLKTGAVLTGSSNPGIAWQSSAGIATLNAEVADHIPVPEGGTEVVIDFDIGRSFFDPADVTPPCGCSGFIFSPQGLRAAQASRTGSVTGSVRYTGAGAGQADATVELKLGNPNDPSYTWATVSTTKTDASGNFRFAYVTRSTFWSQAGWTYMVVASHNGYGATVTNVLVSPGAETAVGPVLLPTSGVSGEL